MKKVLLALKMFKELSEKNRFSYDYCNYIYFYPDNDKVKWYLTNSRFVLSGYLDVILDTNVFIDRNELTKIKKFSEWSLSSEGLILDDKLFKNINTRELLFEKILNPAYKAIYTLKGPFNELKGLVNIIDEYSMLSIDREDLLIQQNRYDGASFEHRVKLFEHIPKIPKVKVLSNMLNTLAKHNIEKFEIIEGEKENFIRSEFNGIEFFSITSWY